MLEACELVCKNAKFIYKSQFSTSCKLSESGPYKTPPSAQRAKLESQHSWRRWPSRWWAARGLANCRLRLLAIFISFQSDFIEILRSACYFCRLGKVTGGYRPPLYNYVQMSSSQVEWASNCENAWKLLSWWLWLPNNHGSAFLPLCPSTGSPGSSRKPRPPPNPSSSRWLASTWLRRCPRRWLSSSSKKWVLEFFLDVSSTCQSYQCH